MWDDRVSEVYKQELGTPRFQNATRARIQWMCRNIEGKNVLDIGCSQGILSILAGRENAHVTGVDSSEKSIAYAKSDLEQEVRAVRDRIDFIHGDIFEVDLPNAPFDSVVLGEILEHFANPSILFERARNLTKKGGRLVVTVPLGLHPFPDHKSTITLTGYLEILPKDIDVETLFVSDRYLYFCGRRKTDEGKRKAFSSAKLLDMSEAAMLESDEILFSRIDELQQKVSDNVARVERLQKTQKNYQLKGAKADDALKDARDQLDTVRRELQDLQMAHAKSQSSAETLEQQLESERHAATRVSEERDSLEAEMSSLETEKASLEAETASLEAEKVSLQTEMASLETEKVSLEAEKTSLEADTATLTAKVETAERDREAFTQEISNLEADYSALMQQKETLSLHQAELETQLSDLKAEHQELADRNNALLEQQDELYEQISEAKRDSRLLSEVSKDKSALQRRNENLLQQLEVQRERLIRMTQLRDRAIATYETVLDATSFKVGRLLTDAVRRPGLNTLVLPLRLLSLANRGLQRRRMIAKAQKGVPSQGPEPVAQPSTEPSREPTSEILEPAIVREADADKLEKKLGEVLASKGPDGVSRALREAIDFYPEREPTHRLIAYKVFEPTSQAFADLQLRALFRCIVFRKGAAATKDEIFQVNRKIPRRLRELAYAAFLETYLVDPAIASFHIEKYLRNAFALRGVQGCIHTYGRLLSVVPGGRVSIEQAMFRILIAEYPMLALKHARNAAEAYQNGTHKIDPHFLGVLFRELRKLGAWTDGLRVINLLPDTERYARPIRFLEAKLDLLHNGFNPVFEGDARDGYEPKPNRGLYILHNSLPWISVGYATRAHGLLHAFNANGLEISGVTRLGFPSDVQALSDAEFGEKDEVDGIQYIRMIRPGSDFRTLDLQSYLQNYCEHLIETVRRERPAFLVGASNFMNGLAATIVARQFGIPSIYEVRSVWEVTRLSRQPSWADSEECRMLMRLETQACLAADAVVVITEAVKAELVRRGVPAGKISVISNGVDIDRFSPSPVDSELKGSLGLEGKTVIGFIGSFVEYEGLDILLRAFKVLLTSRERDDIGLLLVGDGTHMQTLKSLCTELKLDQHVIFTGRVPHGDIKRYYSICDMICLPRRGLPVCEMVSPLKPFEAMAMGTPLIVSDVAALAEIMRDGDIGLLHRKDDVEDLSRTIARLVDDPELRTSLAENALQWVRQHRSWNALGEKFAGIIRGLSDRAQAHPDGMVESSPSGLDHLSLRPLLTDALMLDSEVLSLRDAETALADEFELGKDMVGVEPLADEDAAEETEVPEHYVKMTWSPVSETALQSFTQTVEAMFAENRHTDLPQWVSEQVKQHPKDCLGILTALLKFAGTRYRALIRRSVEEALSTFLSVRSMEECRFVVDQLITEFPYRAELLYGRFFFLTGPELGGLPAEYGEQVYALNNEPIIARNLFFTYRRLGYLEKAVKMSEHLENSDDIKDAVEGVRADWKLLNEGYSPQQSRPVPSYNPQRQRAFYLLHNSLPYASGGYATRTHGLLNGLVGHGWDMFGLTRLGFPMEQGTDVPTGWSENTVDQVNYLHIQDENAIYRKVALDRYLDVYREHLQKKTEELAPAIIHASSNFMNGLVGNAVAQAISAPSIYEVRGFWQLTRISRDPDYRYNDIYDLHEKLEIQAANEATHVITITEALRDYLVVRGVPDEKISVVHNGVDTARFVPLPRNEDLTRKFGLTGKMVIGYIGSIIEYEGLDLLLRAVDRLRSNGFTNFHVLVVGDGDGLEALQALCRDLSLMDFVTFAGRVPHATVNDYYSIMDCMVYPRRAVEVCDLVSPIKPFEAMAMAKPVIVSSVRAMTEFVEDGRTGLIHQKGSAEHLAVQLERLLTDETLRQSIGENARRWVVENRDWENLGRAVGEIYSRLLKEAASTPLKEAV